MKYYAIKKTGAITATKYRFAVTLKTAPFTGEAFHEVKVESADAWRNLLGGYDVDSIGYIVESREHIHGCYNGREAAETVAIKMGLCLAK